MSGLPNPRRDPPPMPPVRAPRDPEAELRDMMFAAYAMQGYVQNSVISDESQSAIATAAYRQADAMLAERKNDRSNPSAPCAHQPE